MSASSACGVRVAAELRVDALAVGPDEERRRCDPAAAERARRRAVGVVDAREARRDLLQERVRAVAVVGEVDAQERDLVAVLGDRVGEERELRAARPAPRGPDVHDDGMAFELRQPRLQHVLAFAGERVRVGGVGAQRRGGVRKPCRRRPLRSRARSLRFRVGGRGVIRSAARGEEQRAQRGSEGCGQPEGGDSSRRSEDGGSPFASGWVGVVAHDDPYGRGDATDLQAGVSPL